MICLEHVSKSFGSTAAVRDVSFEVPRGQVVGLLGSNGAGKTTTIRMVTGFLPPDAGRVRIDGHDSIDASRAARARIGYLAESAPAYVEMSVAGYLAFRARLFRVERRKRPAAIDRVIAQCELNEVRRKRIGHLSKGYRQRVGLAAALVHDPAVLVLDEPGNALDPRQIRHTRSLIRELGRERAVLVSSHVLPEVEQTCDRVIMMAHGRVLAQGDPRTMVGERLGSATYVIECRTPTGTTPEHVQQVLGAIPGVGSVEDANLLADGWCRARVVPRTTSDRSTSDLREAIAAAVSHAGMIVRELHREAVTLERVFMEVIEQQAQEEEPGIDGAGTSIVGGQS